MVNFIKNSQTITPYFPRGKDEKGFLDVKGRRFGPFHNAGSFTDGFGYAETGDKYRGFKRFFIDKDGNRVPEFHDRKSEGSIERTTGDFLSDLKWRLKNRK